MRKVPFLITTCPKCGKRVELWNESDFFAESDKTGIKFFYTCPECGAVEKHPECMLPTYLKEKLVKGAVTRCPKCGKQIYLKEEQNFHAKFEEEKGARFFYTCPECGAIEKTPEITLTPFLREKLIQDAIKRKTLIEFLLIMVGLVLIAFLFVLYLFLFR